MTLYIDKNSTEFTISMPSTRTLKAGETVTINVQPKENLPTGWHSLELKVMGENSEGKIFCKSIYYRFEVSDQYFCGVVTF